MAEFVIHGARQEEVHCTKALGEYFLERLQELGNGVALVQEVDGLEKSVTYAELLASAQKLTSLVRSRSLGPDGTLLLCIGNSLHYAPIMLATLFAGAALAPINPAFDAGDMLHLIKTVKPQVVIVNGEAEGRIKEALSQYEAPVQLIPIEAVDRCLAEKHDVSSGSFRLGEVPDPGSHVAFVMCSSGTSGKPKGVEMTDSMLLTLMLRNDFFNVDGDGETDATKEVMMNLSGPFWVSCQLVTLFCLCRGTKLVLLAPFTEHAFLGHVQKYKVTMLILGPDQIVALAKYSEYGDFDLSSVKSIMYGGAPMSRSMLEMANEKFNVPVTVMYGMTECMGHVLPAYTVRDKPCNVGYLARNTSAKVVDINTGLPVGAGKEGELCFKTSNTFKGYRGNPQATSAMFDSDGFLHTGDVGYYDNDGYFFIVDRIKELIKYRRDHVPATDIEEVLLNHPQVLEAAVFGVYHETDWEHATAEVVVEPHATVTEQDLIALVQASLPEFKWLHGGLRFVASLPRTATGKVQKHELRKKYAQPNQP